MAECRHCGHDVAGSASACPSCGASNPAGRWWHTLVVVLLLLVVGNYVLVHMVRKKDAAAPAATSASAAENTASSADNAASQAVATSAQPAAANTAAETSADPRRRRRPPAGSLNWPHRKTTRPLWISGCGRRFRTSATKPIRSPCRRAQRSRRSSRCFSTDIISG